MVLFKFGNLMQEAGRWIKGKIVVEFGKVIMTCFGEVGKYFRPRIELMRLRTYLRSLERMLRKPVLMSDRGHWFEFRCCSIVWSLFSVICDGVGEVLDHTVCSLSTPGLWDLVSFFHAVKEIPRIAFQYFTILFFPRSGSLRVGAWYVFGSYLCL